MVISLLIIKMLVYFLATYGLATIVSSEYLFIPIVDHFEKWPTVHYLLTCNKCLTVWIGFIFSLLGLGVVSPIIDPFAAYTVTTWLNKILDEEETTEDKI